MTTAQATKSSVTQTAPIHLAHRRRHHLHHLRRRRRHHHRRRLQQTLQIYP